MKKDKTETKAPAEKSAGKAKKIIKIVLNTIINILIVLVLIVSLLVAVMALTSKNDANKLPNIFGYTVQYVQTPSMDVPSPDGYEGGPFTEKDVLIGKIYDVENSPELEVGDIITFNSRQQDEDGNDRLISHRIIEKKKMSDGSFGYRTWGDNREIAQAPDQPENSYLQPFDIIAINYTDDYHGMVLSGWADFMRTIRSPGGFFGIVLIPMIVFFLYAIIRVVISAMNFKKDKSNEEKEEAEAEKQKAIDEAVAAALAEKDGAGEAKTETPADMTPEQMEEFKKFLAFKEAQKASAEESPAEEAPAEEVPAEETPAEE